MKRNVRTCSVGVLAMAMMMWVGAAAQAEPAARERTVVLIPTTHMDIDFTAAPAESMRQYVGFIRQAAGKLHQDAEMRYSVQLTSAMAAFIEAQPRLKEEIGKMLRSGQMELCANWTNPHYSELGEETMIRQIAWSKWWAWKQFEVWLKVADNGELADVTPQLAQVLAGSGVPWFHSYKSAYLSDTRYRGHNDTMWLVGLDGSKVLYNAENYNRSVEQGNERPWGWPGGQAGGVKGTRAVPTGSVILFTDGGPGWDDQLPRFDELGAFVRGWNQDVESRALGQYVLGTYADYFGRIQKQTDKGLRLPVRTGHTEHGEVLYYRIWNLARDRALTENELAQAQVLSAWGEWLGLGAIPAEEFEKIGRDILDTCTHNWAYTDQKEETLAKKAAGARQAVEAGRDEILAKLSARVSVGQWILINTLPHPRKELVKIGQDYRIVDLPACGWVLAPGQVDEGGQKQARDVTAGPGVIENSYYRVRADAAAGLTSVFDKVRGRELLSPVEGQSVLAIQASYNEAMGAERAGYFRPADGSAPMTDEGLGKFAQWLAQTDRKFVVKAVSTAQLDQAVEMTIDGVLGETSARITLRLGEGLDWVEVELSSGPKPTETGPVLDERLNGMVRHGLLWYATLEFNVDPKSAARVSVPFGSVGLPTRMPWVGPADDENFSQGAARAGAEGWYSAYNEAWHTGLEEFFSARANRPRWLTMGGKAEGEETEETAIFDRPLTDGNARGDATELAEATTLPGAGGNAPLTDVRGSLRQSLPGAGLPGAGVPGAGVTWVQYAPYANLFRDKERLNRFHRSLWQGESGSGVYRWRLRGHDGDWRQVGVARLAEEFNAPVLAVAGRGETAELPEQMSFLDIPSQSLTFSSLQPTLDRKGYVLRVYEAWDEPARLKINFSDRLKGWRAVKTDLLEGAESGWMEKGPSWEVKPFEIVTIRLDP
ncbi:MAG: hypothetical protein IT443_04115 [Phycisphaeraceae bacterium]|nr:hypothetical protein [Phycisphaeraceae bacterium]